MLKLVAIGVWTILVTAGATYGSVYLSSMSSSGHSDEGKDAGLEELKSEMASVPIMRNGELVGYLILQLSFAADLRILGERKLDPMPFMMDAALRVIFASTKVDFERLESGDLEKLTEAMAHEANKRIGVDLVRHVLLQQVNYVRKEDIRSNGSSNVPIAK